MIICLVCSFKILSHTNRVISIFESVTDEYINQIINLVFVEGASVDARICIANIIFTFVTIIGFCIILPIAAQSCRDC